MARRKAGPRAWVRVSHRTKDLHPTKRRWEVVYETGRMKPNGEPERRTKGGFPNKAAAEHYRDRETPYGKQNAGEPWVDPASGDVTFQTVAEEWLGTYVSESGKARGKAQHHGIVTGPRSLVRTRWGSRRIGDIGHGEVAAWLAELAATKSPSTMRHNFYTFRLVIRYAVQNGLILRDPTVGIRLPKQQSVKAQQAKRYALTPQQVSRAITATPHPWAMYVRLAAATGMRPEELTGLQLCDLDLHTGTVRVERVWVKDEIARKWIYEDAGKTPAARRTIRLDDFTLSHLRAYLEDVHAPQAQAFFAAHPDRRPANPTALPLFPGVGEFKRGRRERQTMADLDAWEFTDRHGEPKAMMHGWFTRRYWATIREAANLPDAVVFYDLRHFYGSWHAARLGQPGALTLAELAESMGHASTQMTLDRYVHTEPDVDKRNAGAGMWATDESNVVPLRPLAGA